VSLHYYTCSYHTEILRVLRDHVEPPASYLELIQDKLRVQEETKLTSDQAAPFHALPASFWDNFYKHHENRFFKDRKWLHLEFPELIQASLENAPHTRILEVGCGAGNTVFPLLEINKNPNLEIFACDYSSEAVNVVKSHDLYNSPACGRCEASVWDLTSTTSDGGPNLPEGIEADSLDIIVLIFVLSALHPGEWKSAIANVKCLLKEGGIVLVRDYGRYDLPQLRFGKGRLLDDNFYGESSRV
jgi:tRNAThr (cytosine32-N3)-methyltransferase